MTGRYVYPRGTCPRCGGDHALIKDLSRTIVHCCESSGDDIGVFNRGNGFQIGVEIGTGAIVRDPYGEVARAAITDLLRAHLR